LLSTSLNHIDSQKSGRRDKIDINKGKVAQVGFGLSQLLIQSTYHCCSDILIKTFYQPSTTVKIKSSQWAKDFETAKSVLSRNRIFIQIISG